MGRTKFSLTPPQMKVRAARGQGSRTALNAVVCLWACSPT